MPSDIPTVLRERISAGLGSLSQNPDVVDGSRSAAGPAVVFDGSSARHACPYEAPAAEVQSALGLPHRPLTIEEYNAFKAFVLAHEAAVQTEQGAQGVLSSHKHVRRNQYFPRYRQRLSQAWLALVPVLHPNSFRAVRGTQFPQLIHSRSCLLHPISKSLGTAGLGAS